MAVPTVAPDSWSKRLGINSNNIADVGAAVGIIAILTIMVVRLPPMMLDGLFAVSLSSALILLLVSFYLKDALEFSTFPSILLMSTIFRLALNVSSTKLILGESVGGPISEKAGNVINFFGSVVAGKDPVVGFVIFVILVLIQFIVITKGAGRVAEVAARFTLDAMPGKQMAIDADLNSGLITEAEARERRTKIAEEADFYGAMDGASKFVRGDAIAGIVITLINFVGGFIVGAVREGMEASEIFETYTLLTIGDGLVSQIPALLIATTAGIVVTRATSKDSLGPKVASQVFAKPSALYVAAGALAMIAAVAMMSDAGGLSIPFALIAAGVGYSAYQIKQNQDKKATEAKMAEVKESARPAGPEPVEKLLPVDPMEIEIGYGLVPLVDSEQGGDLLERVTAIRRSLALELGLVVPPIRIRDNMQLSPNQYAIKIRGVRMAKGDIRSDRLLAMSAEGKIEDIPGADAIEPAFGLPAKWIRRADRARAELSGHKVIEPVAVLATHLTETIRGHASDILGRQEVQGLIETLKDAEPVVVSELVPDLLSVGQVQKVLQNLLRERIPIRHLGTIFEALADIASQTKDIQILTEAARASLKRVITNLYSDASGTLPVMTLEPQLEETLEGAVQRSDRGSYLALDASSAGRILRGVADAYQEASQVTGEPVLLTTPILRPHLRSLTEHSLGRLPVLSYNELAPDVDVKSVAFVRMAEKATVE